MFRICKMMAILEVHLTEPFMRHLRLKTFQLFIAWVSWRPFSHVNLHQNDHFKWVCWLLRLVKQKTVFRVNISLVEPPKTLVFFLAFSQVLVLRPCPAWFGATAAPERCYVSRVVPLWWYDGACCQMLRPKVLDVVNSVAWPWRTKGRFWGWVVAVELLRSWVKLMKSLEIDVFLVSVFLSITCFPSLLCVIFPNKTTPCFPSLFVKRNGNWDFQWVPVKSRGIGSLCW